MTPLAIPTPPPVVATPGNSYTGIFKLDKLAVPNIGAGVTLVTGEPVVGKSALTLMMTLQRVKHGWSAVYQDNDGCMSLDRIRGGQDSIGLAPTVPLDFHLISGNGPLDMGTLDNDALVTMDGVGILSPNQRTLLEYVDQVKAVRSLGAQVILSMPRNTVFLRPAEQLADFHLHLSRDDGGAVTATVIKGLGRGDSVTLTPVFGGFFYTG